jgi:1,4-alpha-glucan branching enzyme
MDFYRFYTGTEFEAYQYLGAHFSPERTVFRTFAPGAEQVSLLLGSEEILMNRIYDGNFYEIEVSNLKEGVTYEYRIDKNHRGYTDHCDPYGFGMELRPSHRSIVRNMDNYEFRDKNWMKQRKDTQSLPVNIYEIHAGSFRKPKGKPGWYSYEELGKVLIPHLKECGYNYVEFMPLSEHPSDESWGYQNTGFFAPTRRYGTAKQLKSLIDELHQNQIGVLLDFVPVHFALDDYGLRKYGGSELYEYPSADVGISEWGSCNFIHSRGEVRSFLQSCANYWLKEYHFDGLRMDAISRMIYWQGDEKRGENRNAIDFIKVMNQGLKERHPGCILAAEDSTNYPGVTKPVHAGGLGFDYKWNMGWMNDTLAYFSLPPERRVEEYHQLTFSMVYAYNENYLLPLSHDEVVHGKASIVQKMNGAYEEKFPQAKALYVYMMTHPGKKLNFMGNEIGQMREWDERREQDWDLLKYPVHDAFYRFHCFLNTLYLSHPSLSEKDNDPEGFTWIDCHAREKCLYVYQRAAKREKIIVLLNLSNQPQKSGSLALEQKYQVLLDTEWERFGGRKKEKTEHYQGEIVIQMEAYSGMMLISQGSV